MSANRRRIREPNASASVPTEIPDRLLDVHTASELLGLRPSTLYQWAYEGRIPIVKPSGLRGPLRFRLRTLLTLIEQWERPSARGA